MPLSQKQIEQAIQSAVREAKKDGVIVVVEVEDTGFFPQERTYLKVTVHPEKKGA